MQRYRDKPLELGQDEAPDIETMERPKAFDQNEQHGDSPLKHEMITRPDGAQRCGICGRPWPCNGSGAFAVKAP